MAGNELRGGAAEDYRDLRFVFGSRDDDGGLQLEVADELLLDFDAARELRIERNADEAVAPRVDQDAIDPQPRGAEAARDLRLRQAFHEIEPGGADFGLLFSEHQVDCAVAPGVVAGHSRRFARLIRLPFICKQAITFAFSARAFALGGRSSSAHRKAVARFDRLWEAR